MRFLPAVTILSQSRFLAALILVCGCGLLSSSAWAQTQAPQDGSSPFRLLPNYYSSEKVYTYVEKMPIYPGGNQVLTQFIQTHLRYPQGQRTSGKVFVSFVVAKTGDVRNVKVLKSLGEPFDAEAVRVISSLSKWTPGMQNNAPVDVNFTVPVVFSPPDPKQKKP